MSADGVSKNRYYEVVAGAAAACQRGISDPSIDNAQVAHATAEAAYKVVRLREHQHINSKDDVGRLITDAYATVAVAYRRAGGVYTIDKDMQKLGTAAVHLVTMATSYMAAHANDVELNF